MIDDMDEIWVLYADDGGQALDTAEEALRQISEGDADQRKEGISALFRAVHTFKGNSRVLGLQVAESRAHLTEDLIGLVRDQGAEWDREMEEILLLAVDRLRVILEETAGSRQDISDDYATDLMDRLRSKIAKITGADSGDEASDPHNSPVKANPVATSNVDAESDDAPKGSELDEPSNLPVDQPQQEEMAAPLGQPNATFTAQLAELKSEESSSSFRAIPFEEFEDDEIKKSRPPEVKEVSPVVKRAQELIDLTTQALRKLAEVSATGAEADALLEKTYLDIATEAENRGYVRLCDVARLIARNPQADRTQNEIRIYEELYSIEVSLPFDSLTQPRPRHLLTGWCGEHAFQLIDMLNEEVDLLAEHQDVDLRVRQIEPLLRRMSYACDFYAMRSATELAMSLLDVIIRTSMPGNPSEPEPDRTIVQMLGAFINAVELSIDAAKEGEPPNPKPIDDLSRESSRFVFRRKGAITATDALEQLQLPAQFLRVMSPRSVMVAQTAAQEGMSFFVVRTDFKEDNELAEGFFRLIETGAFRQITSVSVLSGTTARFDFLLATNLSAEKFSDALRKIDPKGQGIEILSQVGKADGEVLVSASATDIVGGVSVEMMEMLGDVAAGLATVTMQFRHTLEADNKAQALEKTKTSRKRNSTISAGELALRGELNTMMAQIEQAIQTMEHLGRRVAALQEEAMSSRLRPADHVLRPLVESLRKKARDLKSGASISIKIAQVPLDKQTLEALDAVCSHYVAHRIEHHGPDKGEIVIALRKRDDRVLLTVLDHVEKIPTAEEQDALREMASPAGGRVWLQFGNDGSRRLAVSLPTKLLAMDGMIVTSGDVSYVLPVDALSMVLQTGPERVIRRAAAGSGRFLRMDSGEVIPITTLNDINPDKGGIFVIVQAEGRRKAVKVDALIGQQVVRLRPLQGVLSRLDRLAGVAVLAGGEIALVLSPLSICFGDEIETMAFSEA